MKPLCFSENFKALRISSGATQKTLAEALQVSPRTLSLWEKGERIPTVEQALAVAERFGLTVEELFYGEEESLEKIPGMASMTELYKIGSGPSSSHTMGPEKACMIFKERYPNADRFAVTLYGSLAKTGEGHGTDRVIVKTLAPIPCAITFDTVTGDLPHPNTMELFAYRGKEEIARTRVYSVGAAPFGSRGNRWRKVSIFTTLTPSTIFPPTAKRKGFACGNTSIRWRGTTSKIT